MTKIYAPNHEYDGITFGEQFTNGEADVTDEDKVAWFTNNGYSTTAFDRPEVEAGSAALTQEDVTRLQQERNAVANALEDAQIEREKHPVDEGGDEVTPPAGHGDEEGVVDGGTVEFAADGLGNLNQNAGQFTSYNGKRNADTEFAGTPGDLNSANVPNKRGRPSNKQND